MGSSEHIGPAQISNPEAADRALKEVQEHFLSRLQQLTAKREQQAKVDPMDKLALRLLARALYSTYMDCVAAGIGDQANDILGTAQVSGQPEPTTKHD